MVCSRLVSRLVAWTRSCREFGRVRARIVIAAAALCGITVPSCYFAPPPLPGDPAPERPNLNLNGAVPPVFQVLSVQDGGAPVNFTVPFTSVDANSYVWIFLWANWTLDGTDVGGVKVSASKEGKKRLPPRSSLPDEGMGGSGPVERAIQFSWTPSGSIRRGCNQLTLFVTHEDNADFEADLPLDFSKAAIVTWWVNVDASLDQQSPLNCPAVLPP